MFSTFVGLGRFINCQRPDYIRVRPEKQEVFFVILQTLRPTLRPARACKGCFGRSCISDLLFRLLRMHFAAPHASLS